MMDLNTSEFNRMVRVCSLVALTMTGVACTSSETTEEDSLSHYTLSNEFIDMEVLQADSATLFGFGSRVNDQRNQEWIVTAIDNASYRISNRELGDTLSLDVLNDGVFETLIMASTEDVSGQQWQVTPLSNGYCRLTNAFLGSEIALDVVSDTTEPTLTMRPIGNFSGQHWRFIQHGFQPVLLDGLCSGEPSSM